MSEMTTAISPSSFTARAKQNKPPSFPSESLTDRRQKTRDVASRYLSGGGVTSSSSFFNQSSPSKRCQSPTVTRPVTTSGSSNRPQSTGRRESVSTVTKTNRPVTPNRTQSTPRRGSLDRRSSGDVSEAQRMLLTSGRSLFTSFQADSFTGNENRSTLISSPVTSQRGIIEKKKIISRSVGPQQEKSKLSEQWPKSLQPSCLSRSVDFTDVRKKLNNGVVRALQNLEKVGSNSMISEIESVSSVSYNGRGKKLPSHGTVVKARLEPGSPVAKSNGVRKNFVDSSVLSPKGVATTTRSQLFPKRELIRPASPSKFGMSAASSSPRGASIARGISPSRGVISSRGISPSGRMSPLRARSSLPLNLNFAVDAKEKIRENGVSDAHLLRLLHNRLLQWRFSNARTNAVIYAQKMKAEKRLYNAWISISKLYDSVRAKRIELQHLKQNLKLISILNRQMGHLEEWFVMDRDYTGSLVGAAEALKGSTLCLPVDCGAMVNVQSVKDAICSAVDVMQAMASSICMLLPKVGKINCLAAELGRVNVKEQGMLNACRDLLNAISSLQVTECSLRTQELQLQYQTVKVI